MKGILMAAILVAAGAPSPPSGALEGPAAPVVGGQTFVCHHALSLVYVFATVFHLDPDALLDMLFSTPECMY
jgi:hypothetical protein